MTTTFVPPTATPTPEPELREDCFGDLTLAFPQINTNENPCLDALGPAAEVDLGTPDGRYVSLYPGYWYYQQPGTANTLAYMNAGLYMFRDGPEPAMVLDLVQVNGDFGIQAEQVFEAGDCVLVKQTGSNRFVSRSMDDVWLEGMIWLTEDGREYPLREQSFWGRVADYEVFWIVQAPQYTEAVVAVWTHIVRASYLNGTYHRIHTLEFLFVPGS